MEYVLQEPDMLELVTHVRHVGYLSNVQLIKWTFRSDFGITMPYNGF